MRVSREHRVAVERPGLVRVSGGKYTTYRVMAADAVDAVLGEAARTRPTVTAELPLVGAAPRAELDALAARLAAEPGMDEGGATSLVERHGTEAPRCWRWGASRTSCGAWSTVTHTSRRRSRGRWCASGRRRWTTCSPDGCAWRRCCRTAGESLAPRVAAIAAADLGWDADRQASAVALFLPGRTASSTFREPARTLAHVDALPRRKKGIATVAVNP